MLVFRFPTAAALEVGARITLCASGGLSCGQGVGSCSPQRKRPSAGLWGGDIVTTRWRPRQQRCTLAGQIDMDFAAFGGWVSADVDAMAPPPRRLGVAAAAERQRAV